MKLDELRKRFRATGVTMVIDGKAAEVTTAPTDGRMMVTPPEDKRCWSFAIPQAELNKIPVSELWSRLRKVAREAGWPDGTSVATERLTFRGSVTGKLYEGTITRQRDGDHVLFRVPRFDMAESLARLNADIVTQA